MMALLGQSMPVYWLGTEFSAGDLVFRGPYGAEFGIYF
ncbi:MAG: hypothetical protein QG663_751, partial [Thermodesulfobacteriota bacterium]|nr:hypothetical protein [Thermodesulfobacteriota bacterium]